MALITKDLNTPALTAQQLAQFIVGDTGTVVAGTAKFTDDNRAAGTWSTEISEIVFIDTAVADYQSLVAGVKPGITTVILDSKQDGIAQISEYLADCQELSALHVISHGSPGSLQLGTVQLSLDTLNCYGRQLQKWAASLTAKAEILLYGCSVAAGDRGQAFVEEISRLTKAKIAASTTPSGSAALGGDWQLQETVGDIEIPLAIRPETLDNYAFTLATLNTASGDGGLTVGVDEYGSFGRAVGGTGTLDANYDPIGAAVSAGTTFQSGVAIRVGGTGGYTFLTTGSIGNTGGLNPTTINSTPTSTQSTFNFGGLNFALTQTVTDLVVNGVRKGSLLTQTYRITNPGTTRLDFELMRYVDGDLNFDNSIQDTGGRRVSGTEEILFETDSGDNPATPTTFVGITGIGGSNALPGRYEIDQYLELRDKITVGGALDDTVYGDGLDADEFIDSFPIGSGPYDLALALRNRFSLEANQSSSYATTTIFGTLPPNEVNLPVLSITPLGSPAEAGSIPGTFRITRTNSEGQLSVNFNVAGSATFTTDYTATGTNANFTPTSGTAIIPNGQTSVDLTITPIDDNIFDPNENVIFTIAPGINYILGSSNTASLTIADNDTRGIVVTSVPPNPGLTEGGSPNTYRVALRSQPTQLVIFTLKPDTQTDLGTGAGNPVSFNFSPSNWNVPQTITVRAVDDTVAEGPHSSTITGSVTSADANYDGAVPVTLDGTAVANITLPITDNDTPQVKITETGGSTKIGEGGATDNYTAVLTSQPAADVTVTASPDAQSDVGTGGGSPIALKFTPSNWNVPQLVTVQAVDDAVAQGTHSSTIAHKVTSIDAKYNLIATPSVIAQITDNDTAGVTITPPNTTATEGGATGSYKVALTSKPTAPVKVNFNSGIQIESISTFTFTSDNWNLPQTVTVKATDDSLVEGLHTGTINHSIAVGSATEYLPVAIAPVTVSITDNDVANPSTPSVTIAPASTNATEGGATGSYKVSLNTKPTANVTVNVAVGSQINAIAPIVFTPVNWNAPQTVTVTATDDTVVEGAHTGTINHSVAAGSAAEYLPVAIAPVSVTIADNDTATSTSGVKISPTNTSAAEGGANGSYSAVLTSQPSSEVKVSFATDSQIEAIAPFTFTSANWNLPQTATVKAVDDSAVEGTQLSIITTSASSTDLAYNNIGIPKVDVLILDNDIPGIAVTPNSTNAAEGGAAGSYSIVLTKAPTAPVTVNFAAGSQINAIAPIVFTPANWNAPQTVTVTATDDTVVEGTHSGIISHSVAAGSAAEYLPVAIAPVSVTITDNDTATTATGVTVTQTGGSTIVAEGGTTDTYQIVLNSQPSSDVKVSFATDSQIDAIASFTFTSANWNLPQTATVKAVDDSAVEGTHLSTIASSASSTDLAYNNIGIPKVDVLILDNDIPGIAVTPTSTNAAEGGATGSYSVVLTKAPTANVTVNFAAGSQIDAIAPIVFTPANWNAAQTVTVKATDDSIVEGTHTGLIFSSVAPGSAAEYLPVAIAPVTVTIADNDITPPTPTPVINFSPTIIVPTPTPVINFSPTIIVSAPTPEPTPGPVPTPPPTPAPVPTPPPTPTPTPLSPPLTPTPQPNADPDCICAQITLPDISPLHGFNPVDNNLVGGDRNETLSGGSGGDGINGLSGDDVLVGLAGNDNLFGGFISNIPVGPSVDRDLLLGGPGDDYLNGQAGYDTLFGGQGNDAAFGGKDNDLIWGGRGSDTLVGEEGNDSLYGGTNSESDRDRTGNDLLFGAKGNDYLSGQDASDSISGGDGSDTARGGKGNDVILGDSGSDSLLGDQGNDSICGGDGDDTVYGDIGSPLPVGVAGGQDQVCGGAGNDLLFGNEGSDTINGDAGNDTILGGKDSDSLVGGAGDDVLIGDEGSDTLVGGSGRDLFVLTSAQGSDTISDFRKGEDLLSLAGGLTFTQLSISQSTDGRDASPATFIRISNSGELIAVLNGVQASAIAQSDFVQLLRLGI